MIRVEDEAALSVAPGPAKIAASLLFGLAADLASLPVRTDVRASVGGYLPFLVLAREHVPVAVRPALRLTHA